MKLHDSIYCRIYFEHIFCWYAGHTLWTRHGNMPYVEEWCYICKYGNYLIYDCSIMEMCVRTIAPGKLVYLEIFAETYEALPSMIGSYTYHGQHREFLEWYKMTPRKATRWRSSSFSLPSPSVKSGVVVLTACVPAETDASKLFFEGFKLVCTLHVVYEM